MLDGFEQRQFVFFDFAQRAAMCGTDAGVVNPLRRKITFFRRIRNRMLRLFVIGFVGNDNVEFSSITRMPSGILSISDWRKCSLLLISLKFWFRFCNIWLKVFDRLLSSSRNNGEVSSGTREDKSPAETLSLIWERRFIGISSQRRIRLPKIRIKTAMISRLEMMIFTASFMELYRLM